MGLKVGTKLGVYEVLAPAGAGGMGEVYRARHPELQRDVAIKLLPASFANDPDRLRRFQQEARVAAALTHPNILQIFDVGAQNGTPYIVTEFLEGETLRERLRSGALSLRKAIEYGIEIAHALAAAHAKNIIHRDLKPENIFITSDGRLKVLDFGLAKSLEAETGSENLTRTRETEAGVVLGTVGYMSPEQVRGQATDQRSDIFAFGAVLYEMISGKRAFRGETNADTMSAILKDDPPELSETNRNISPALERIVHHCLEKNPAERFQSASDVAFALEALSHTSSASSRALAVAEPSRRKYVVPALAALVVVLAIAGAYLLGRGASAAPQPEFHRLTYQRGIVFGGRFAPDGSIVYSAAWDGAPRAIFSTHSDFPESRALGVQDADVLAVSSSGELAVAVNGAPGPHLVNLGATLARMPLAGGAPREVLEDVTFADWSPSGELAVVHRYGGQDHLEYPTGHDIVQTAGWISDIRFSPDGKQIAYLDHPGWPDDRGDVAVVDADGKNKKILARDFESEDGLAWDRQTGEICFSAVRAGSNQRVWAVNQRGELRQRLEIPSTANLKDIAPDGRLLITVGETRLGIRALAAGEKQEKDLSWFSWTIGRDISPDRKLILLDESSEPAGPHYAVGVRRFDGSPVVRLGEGSAGCFLPDGKWVIAVIVGDIDKLILLPVGAGEPRTILTPKLEHVGYEGVGCLPDGKHVMVDAWERGRPARTYSIALEGGEARAVTPEGIVGQGVSHDGRFVAAWNGQRQLAIYPAAGGEPHVVPGVGGNFSVIGWSDDGRAIYVASNELPAKVLRVDTASGRMQLVRQLMPPDPAGLQVIRDAHITSDGASYIYTYARSLHDLYVVSKVK